MKEFALVLVVFLKIAWFAADAHAVVMYDEGREFVNGISLLRDKDDASAYYYLPTAPRVVIDPATGKPKMSLIKFIDPGGETSGGLVHFLFSLDLPQEEIDELQEALSKKVPGAQIKGASRPASRR